MSGTSDQQKLYLIPGSMTCDYCGNQDPTVMPVEIREGNTDMLVSSTFLCQHCRDLRQEDFTVIPEYQGLHN